MVEGAKRRRSVILIPPWQCTSAVSGQTKPSRPNARYEWTNRVEGVSDPLDQYPW